MYVRLWVGCVCVCTNRCEHCISSNTSQLSEHNAISVLCSNDISLVATLHCSQCFSWPDLTYRKILFIYIFCLASWKVSLTICLSLEWQLKRASSVCALSWVYFVTLPSPCCERYYISAPGISTPSRSLPSPGKEFWKWGVQNGTGLLTWIDWNKVAYDYHLFLH